jgi:hypothetical protein
MYTYTNAHQAALELYVLSLGGKLKPQDEPLNLIKAAIERGRAKEVHKRDAVEAPGKRK